MTVYQRSYRGFTGELTSILTRPWVITRYALGDLFQSKRFIAFFLACLLPSLLMFAIISLRYSIGSLGPVAEWINELAAIDAEFFSQFHHRPASLFAFFLVMLVGPALVSPDLQYNAMPLYLSRPCTKLDYIIGKLLCLLILVSAVTWIPGLFLFGLQSILGEAGWASQNSQIPFAMVSGHLLYMLNLSLLALAISAWVKWKLVARLAFFGLFIVSSAVGRTISAILESWQGNLLSIPATQQMMMDYLYETSASAGIQGWASICLFIVGSFIALCALALRIRAREVIR